jgi:hypothetical protein
MWANSERVFVAEADGRRVACTDTALAFEISEMFLLVIDLP